MVFFSPITFWQNDVNASFTGCNFTNNNAGVDGGAVDFDVSTLWKRFEVFVRGAIVLVWASRQAHVPGCAIACA